MIPSASVKDRLRRAFRPTQNGVVGLTEQLLEACVGAMLSLNGLETGAFFVGPRVAICKKPLPFSPAAFRTTLARVASLCNERSPGSVSPYGGAGQLAVGAAEVSVKFMNTAQAQKLAVKSDQGGNNDPQLLPEADDAAVAGRKSHEASEQSDTTK